jgi:hypothetical protein
MTSKVEKEADLYKDLPTKKLKKIIRQYKFLSLSNSDIFNFVFTLVSFGVPYFILIGFTSVSIFFFILVHYLFYWEFLFKYKNFKLVSDEDKQEIDEIVKILDDHLKNRANKKPLD